MKDSIVQGKAPSSKAQQVLVFLSKELQTSLTKEEQKTVRQESLLKCVCAAAFMFSHSNIDLLCSLQYYFSEYQSELCHKYKTQSINNIMMTKPSFLTTMNDNNCKAVSTSTCYTWECLVSRECWEEPWCLWHYYTQKHSTSYWNPSIPGKIF